MHLARVGPCTVGPRQAAGRAELKPSRPRDIQTHNVANECASSWDDPMASAHGDVSVDDPCSDFDDDDSKDSCSDFDDDDSKDSCSDFDDDDIVERGVAGDSGERRNAKRERKRANKPPHAQAVLVALLVTLAVAMSVQNATGSWRRAREREEAAAMLGIAHLRVHERAAWAGCKRKRLSRTFSPVNTSPSACPWAKLLERTRAGNQRDALNFRRRFRVTVATFDYLLDTLASSEELRESADATGRRSIGLDIKLLAFLRVLGRGWFFDDVAEATGMSEETARRSFHAIAHVIATGPLNDVHLSVPSEARARLTESQYAEMGAPGCVGCTDATHIRWDRCPAGFNSTHYNAKESTCMTMTRFASMRAHLTPNYPTTTGCCSLVWQATADRQLRCCSLSPACAGAWPDITVTRYDEYVLGIYWNKVYPNLTYDLQRKDGSVCRRSGPWLMVDGGYDAWWCLQGPEKHALDVGLASWSDLVCAIRKDSERLFGVVKGRWRLLKQPLLFGDARRCNHAVRAAFVLNNVILDRADETIEMVERFLGRDGLCEQPVQEMDCDSEAARGGALPESPPVPPPGTRPDRVGWTMPRGGDAAKRAHKELKMQLIEHYSVMKERGAVVWGSHGVRPHG